MKTVGTIAFTYFILLVLTLFVLLIIPKAYSAVEGKSGANESLPLGAVQAQSNRAPASESTYQMTAYRGPASGSPSRSTSSCRALVEELNQMKKAQNQIITSLAQNHDLFADQLSDLSFELSLYRKTVPQKALDSMEKSAQAYHSRALKAQQSAEKLDDLTGDLIERIQRCLK